MANNLSIFVLLMVLKAAYKGVAYALFSWTIKSWNFQPIFSKQKLLLPLAIQKLFVAYTLLCNSSHKNYLNSKASSSGVS